MLPFFLRVLLAANADRQAHSGTQCLRDLGHKVVAESPQSELLPLEPDAAIIGTSSPDSPVPARPADAVPAVRTTRPTALMDLLAQQMARRAAEM
jgi:hypothetical protein